MKHCPSCHQENLEEATFCVECGASIKSTRTDHQHIKQKKGHNKKVFLGLALIIVLLIALLIIPFTGYQLLAKKYSQEAVEEQFKTALVDRDLSVLKTMIQSDDSRVKINDESLKRLFTLIDNEPSIVQEITDGLDADAYDTAIFTLEKDGKHFGIYDRYIIQAQGYFLMLSNESGGETTFYLNEEKIGELSEEEDSLEVGPFLAGSYLIKATSKQGKQEGEDMKTVKLAGNEAKLEVYLDTETMDVEEEEEISTLVSTSNSAYVIPDSRATYLTTSDLSYLTNSELRIARNEIFARYGYIFESKALQNYFNSMDWYSPDPGYDGFLTDVEKHNVDLIKSFE